MKKIFTTVGIIIFAIYLLFQLMYVTSDQPPKDATKLANELLHNSLEWIDEN